MAKDDSRNIDNPKLKEKKLQNGKIALYLDYYLGRVDEVDKETGCKVSKVKRQRQYLKLYLLANPRTPKERESNKTTKELAKKIRAEKEQELKQQMYGYRLERPQTTNFHDYYQEYIDNYKKQDIRNLKLAYRRFVDFLNDTPKYKQYISFIKPQEITKDLITDFTEYLKSRSYGKGADSLYSRFKKVIKYGVEHDVFKKNPCEGVRIKTDENIIRKDILSVEEIMCLYNTHYEKENPIIRRAFIFCCYTGLRNCDVRSLTFANVDFANKLLHFEQNKTKGHSAASGVIIPLNDNLLKLIGHPQQESNRNDVIFPLPSIESCNKSLKYWASKAGVEKHLSWHCARHSFAVNVLNGGANIKVVASLLGHSGLKHIDKYLRAVDKLKEDAINSLPQLDI